VGKIGRGFVGLMLHQAGYEIVFADAADALITALDAADRRWTERPTRR
jgi:mannitol-1-phosphate 5-dehydrogenase